ncbi:MAG: methyltransferase [Pseudomonadota bacterium]|nr:methyltransferase [Pseudomonadota bacterium]
MLSAEDESLRELLGELAQAGYHFVTPTPETHRRVIARRGQAKNLRDIFGWSLPFLPQIAGPRIFALLETAEMLIREGSTFKSAVRVSSVGDALFVHSAYPTAQADSVFFGPDSYRFVEFLRRELAGTPPFGRLVDIGTGSGVGGIMAASAIQAGRVTLSDINPLALRFARINASHNDVEVETVEAPGVDGIEAPIELAISNPPFMMDNAGRAYRDGGGMHGAALSLDWALATAAKLAPGGRMLLYTASAIVGGRDRLREALTEELGANSFQLRYREIDPDVFGEQIEEPGYEEVERIAVVGIVIERLDRDACG